MEKPITLRINELKTNLVFVIPFCTNNVNNGV